MELHLNRRQLRSFGRELPSAEIIGKKRCICGNADCWRQLRSRNQVVESVHELSAVVYDLSTTITAFNRGLPGSAVYDLSTERHMHYSSRFRIYAQLRIFLPPPNDYAQSGSNEKQSASGQRF
jgi:hypothetical protein